MNKLTSQRGVGLIEVLVAVLLLSVAVLGFSALQMRAISATDESLVRTKSLTLVRNLADIMRAYPEAYVTGSGTAFVEVKPTNANGVATAGAVPTVQAIITSTALDNIVVGDKTVSISSAANNCLSTEIVMVGAKATPKQPCSTNQLAARDALMVKDMATKEDIKLAVVTCPGTSAQSIQQQMCIITAWNDTKAIMDDTDAKACAGVNGVYKTGSQCLISEAY